VRHAIERPAADSHCFRKYVPQLYECAILMRDGENTELSNYLKAPLTSFR